MDFFQGMIAKILVDVTKAQDIGNRYSASLVPMYENPERHGINPILCFFPIPNAKIDSFKIKINFGIDELKNTLAQRKAIRVCLLAAVTKAVALIDSNIASSNEKDADANGRVLTETLDEIASDCENLLLVLIKHKLSINNCVSSIAELIERQAFRRQATLGNQSGFVSLQSMAEVISDDITAACSLIVDDLGQTDSGICAIVASSVLNDLGPELLGEISLTIDMKSFKLGFTETKRSDQIFFEAG